MARYKSPFWGTALIALIACHWKIFLFLLLEKPRANDAIAFIEANASLLSISSALVFAAMYVILFPWFELALSKISSYGTRLRNDFKITEREREIGQRKVIAHQQASIIEVELKNREDQSKLADIELTRNYQSILSGENFTRWLKDAQKGALSSQLGNSIANYLNKADSLEGRFINPAVATAHEKFIEAISTLNSAINDGRPHGPADKNADILTFARDAQLALQAYRSEVRENLGV